MRRYALKRLLALIPTFLLIVVLSFCIIRLAPGSPFTAERAISMELRQALESRYGFDQPLPVQLGRYLTRLLLHGDLGLSTKYPQRSVNSILAAGLPHTLCLGLAALAWALTLGLGAGILAAQQHQRRADRWAMGLAMLGLSTPTFVLGPLLVLIFALQLGWLPAAGWGSWRHLVLPAITLGTVYAAAIARLTRAGLLEVMGADFVRTARAKGLPEGLILRRHVLRAGLLPTLTYLGPASAGLLVGSVVVEKIFNIPGIGPYFVDAAFNRDYFLVMGVVVLESGLLLLLNLAVDLAYGWLDPRIRLQP